MIPGLWRPSFPEIVLAGNIAWCHGNWLAAGERYWLAAFIAPTDDEASRMLEWSWKASERAQGRVSELEKV